MAGAVLQTNGMEKLQKRSVTSQAVSSALNFPLLKEVSQNCFGLEEVSWNSFVFNVKLKIEEVSHHSFFFDVAKLKD